MGDFPAMPRDALDLLSALNTSNLPHVATVTAVDATGTRVGGALVTSAGAVLLVGEPCRLTPSQPSPLLADAQARSVQQFTLAFRRGVVVSPNAIAAVTGRDRPEDSETWTRHVRVVESMRERLATSMARYSCVDAGAAGNP